MPNENLTDDVVLTAATALVAAFRATDTRAYFDSFAEDATFVFHTEQHRLDTRAAYEQLWAAGGIPHAVFPLTYAELLTLTGGTETEVA